MRALPPAVSSTIGSGRRLRTRRLVAERPPDARFLVGAPFFAHACTSHLYRLACSPQRVHERAVRYALLYVALYIPSEARCNFLRVASYAASSSGIGTDSIIAIRPRGAFSYARATTTRCTPERRVFTNPGKIVQPVSGTCLAPVKSVIRPIGPVSVIP